jgi:hypothetical protein
MPSQHPAQAGFPFARDGDGRILWMNAARIAKRCAIG